MDLLKTQVPILQQLECEVPRHKPRHTAHPRLVPNIILRHPEPRQPDQAPDDQDAVGRRQGSPDVGQRPAGCPEEHGDRDKHVAGTTSAVAGHARHHTADRQHSSVTGERHPDAASRRKRPPGGSGCAERNQVGAVSEASLSLACNLVTKLARPTTVLVDSAIEVTAIDCPHSWSSGAFVLAFHT